jgi:hypothetical protein
MTFVMEYIIHNMLLPGQIENWCVLTDMHDHGLNVTINEMRRIVGILQNNFRGRLGCCYIVNAPKSFSFLWRMCKPFVDSVTVEKIDITRSSHSEKMMAHFNPEQVEERYGGSAKNLTHFWPPYVPDAPFHRTEDIKNTLLSSRSSYYDYHPEVKIQNDELEIIEETREHPPSPKQVDAVFSMHSSFNISMRECEMEVIDLEIEIEKKPKKSRHKHSKRSSSKSRVKRSKGRKKLEFDSEAFSSPYTVSITDDNIHEDEQIIRTEGSILDISFQNTSGISAINDSFHESFFEKRKKRRKHKVSTTPDILERREFHIEVKTEETPITVLAIESTSTNCGCWSAAEKTRTCIIF